MEKELKAFADEYKVELTSTDSLEFLNDTLYKFQESNPGLYIPQLTRVTNRVFIKSKQRFAEFVNKLAEYWPDINSNTTVREVAGLPSNIETISYSDAHGMYSFPCEIIINIGSMEIKGGYCGINNILFLQLESAADIIISNSGL